jgi:ABC-2 type transport system permease protein
LNLALLYGDELRGFYKSKVMIFLWIGLPIITILFRFVQVSYTGQEIAFTVISSLVVSSLAGTLAAVMLTVSIINEKNRHVFELFLIRPLKRRDIVLAKYLAVFSAVAIAACLSIGLGIIADYITTGALPSALNGTAQSLAISLSMLAVSCSAGVLIGIASPSILVGAILVIYGGNQISIIPLIPTLLNIQNANLFTIILATIVTCFLVGGSISLFNKKQF